MADVEVLTMSRKLLLLGLAGCAAVSSSSGSNPGAGPSGTSEVPGVVRESFVVHEWGTFTSMQSSAGKTLEGMHHEEEALPQFVYGRNGGTTQNPKEMEAPASEISGVTQKLETPVLYFYSADPIHASVGVKFPGGILSEWYPQARSYSPALGQWQHIADGSMDWDIDVTPGLGGFPEVAPDDVWAPSRHVASTPIAVGAEHEKFIFYRGLGAFEGPFRSTADASGNYAFTNESDEAIPAAFLLRVHEAGGGIVSLGSIAGHGTLKDVVAPFEGKERNLDAYVDTAKATIRTALVASGLFEDEAQAMVDTWSRSYFKTPGTRVLYVVPRAWTDRLLPLQITPTPGKLVRTLVGRVEVLSQADEMQVVGTVEKFRAEDAAPAALVTALGRFAEPKLRSACEKISQASEAYCASSVENARKAF